MQFIIKMQNKLEKERKCSSSMRNADFCTFFFSLAMKLRKIFLKFIPNAWTFALLCSITLMMKGYLEQKLQGFYFYLFIFNLLIKTTFLKDAIS